MLTLGIKLLLPMLSALGVGVLLRQWLQSNRSNRVAKWADSIALKILLPILVTQALLAEPISSNLLQPLAIGFCLPLALLVLLRLLGAPWAISIAGSTFGGGSRGTAFALIVLAASPLLPGVMRWFVLIDLANFACMLFALPLFIRAQGGSVKAPPTEHQTAWQMIKGNYAFYVIALVAGLLLLDQFGFSLKNWLEQTATARSSLLSFTLFLSIAIKSSFTRQSVPFRDTALFFLARLIMLGLVLTLGRLVDAPNSLLIASAILLCMPPSSLIPKLAEQWGVNPTQTNMIALVTVQGNLLYAILVVLAIAFTLVQ
jgi:hypothetical protein